MILVPTPDDVKVLRDGEILADFGSVTATTVYDPLDNPSYHGLEPPYGHNKFQIVDLECLSYDTLQRNSEYEIFVNGFPYNITTGVIQEDYQITCTARGLAHAGNFPDYDPFGEWKELCYSNFGYCSGELLAIDPDPQVNVILDAFPCN